MVDTNNDLNEMHHVCTSSDDRTNTADGDERKNNQGNDTEEIRYGTSTQNSGLVSFFSETLGARLIGRKIALKFRIYKFLPSRGKLFRDISSFSFPI